MPRIGFDEDWLRRGLAALHHLCFVSSASVSPYSTTDHITYHSMTSYYQYRSSLSSWSWNYALHNILFQVISTPPQYQPKGLKASSVLSIRADSFELLQSPALFLSSEQSMMSQQSAEDTSLILALLSFIMVQL